MANARHYAEYCMRGTGNLPPTLFLVGADGRQVMFMPESLTDIKAKDDFAMMSKLAAVACGATMAVMALESWLKMAWLDAAVANFISTIEKGGLWFSLCSAVVALSIFTLVKERKKHASLNAAFDANASSIGGISAGVIGLVMAIHFFFSPPPEKHTVDFGVNWALENVYRVRQSASEGNIFDSYRIVNQYTERVGSERHFVFDFEANCSLIVSHSMDGAWLENYEHSPNNKLSKSVMISGSVTLVRKGNAWFATKTVHVH